MYNAVYVLWAVIRPLVIHRYYNEIVEMAEGIEVIFGIEANPTRQPLFTRWPWRRASRGSYVTTETRIFYDTPYKKQFKGISAHNVRSVTIMRPPAASILYEMARVVQESTSSVG